MKTQLSPLELLEKFFSENSEETVNQYLAKFDSLDIQGPTVHEYFSNFHVEFAHYSKNNFLQETECSSITDIVDSFGISDISTKVCVLIESIAKNDLIDTNDVSYALAA